MKNKKYIASGMLLLASVFWGLSYSAQSIMSNKINTFTIITLKGFGGILLLFCAVITKRGITSKMIKSGIMIGFINGLGLIFQQLGLAYSTVSKTSFISSIYIIFVPIIELFTCKKPKKKFWIAVLIACLGLYFMCVNEELKINSGDLFTFCGSICFALQVIFIDKYSKDVDPVSFCAIQQTTISIMSAILMCVFERPKVSDFSGLLFPVLYVIFISGLLAQLIQNKYQKDIDPTLASLLMSFESVFGALGGLIILNQTLSIREIIGCILIFISILIAE